MKKLKKQLETAVRLLSDYDGTEPFHLYLNRQFKANRQFGSADRRFYKQACFGFWRNMPSGTTITTEHVANALQGMRDQSPELQQLIEQEGWDIPDVQKSPCVTEKFADLISEKIPYADYAAWFRSMPPVYLVPNPGRDQQLQKKLGELGVTYEVDGMFVKASNSPLIQQCTNEGLCRVMDKASALSVLELPMNSDAKVWDCCSGAGGKALLLSQVYPGIHLYCSDKRAHILENLKQRFAASGMRTPKTAPADLSTPVSEIAFGREIIQGPVFDVIVADVPCSGSGTWRHNPEQPHFFKTENLDAITSLQKDILRHALPFLKPQGRLVYITCSVFSCENEEMADWCESEQPLDPVFQGYLGRKAENADYMYRAVFRKPPAQTGS